MKRKLGTLFGVAVVASSVCVLAFVNNLAAIVNWWRAFLAAEGDSSRFAAKASGFVSWLDWTAVDYSAVTTLIPALGCVCLTVSLYRMLRGRRAQADDFPFFRGPDQLNVALGLFGTLWGIIVIGYSKLDTVSMADLMQCLHTALFSTLTAVVWVFMIDRPLVRPYFQRLLKEAELAETDTGDLSAAVERLVVRLGEASDAFDARQKAADAAFRKRQEEADAAFRKRQEDFETAFEARFQAYEDAAQTRLASYESAQAARQADYASSAEARQKAADAAFEKRMSAYEAAFEARQKEYHEFFLRRIAELEKRADEERSRADAEQERADRVVKKLGAVADALR